MFHNITEEILARMKVLEEKDAIDREDGTPRLQRLRQIPPETGKFLAIMASSSPAGNLTEVGTSAGYSTMWLSLAAKIRNQKIITFELMEEKIELAKETFQLAKIEKWVDLREGDALVNLESIDNVAFCFLDCEKHLYFDVYNKIVPKLVPGGLLVCDNAINHRETLEPMIKFAESDERVDTILVPIGKGEFICRKT
ncbi:tRNA 5-hydroxyuridine methyltransferase [Candidatus Lokiarchaeum ossiferum]|uniref:tRNA 5-hydroxyuridine methyltransferase n=1 Tax=Candidatus Lokiarchaeum ossiferum TaxID=2951803 RepID=A0ABY6HLA4_9ARCH|nr:tRNA 5-hydroxyuridine methyltransferase [Candidatus Lokiarchaeum sp. B-35]